MTVMTPDGSDAQIADVERRLESSERLHVLIRPGELRTAIGPIGGPCTVESRDQTLAVARAVAAAGASMLRGGAFKPRTLRFAFKGLGLHGLEILAEARAETGLPIVTELLDAQHADGVLEYVDVVQIGARNMQNDALLEVAGRLGKPVPLKRGPSSTVEELLMAAEAAASSLPRRSDSQAIRKSGRSCQDSCSVGMREPTSPRSVALTRPDRTRTSALAARARRLHPPGGAEN